MSSQPAPGSGTSPQPRSPGSSLPRQSTLQHAPAHPSGLREAHTFSSSPTAASNIHAGPSASEPAHVGEEETEPLGRPPPMSDDFNGFRGSEEREAPASSLGNPASMATEVARETTALLRKPIEYVAEHVHPGPCHHGTFSPHPGSRSGSIIGGLDSSGRGAGGNDDGNSGRWTLSETIVDGLVPKMGKRMGTTASRIAEEHRIKASTVMYLAYYIPFFAWVKQYKCSFFHGDLVAAITMASIYIPMALSLAANLGHVPPINGLYSFVFNPIVYALLGSCPQLIVGPEAAGSLLLGSVVRDTVNKGKTGDEDLEQHAKVAGLVTGIAGSVILMAGLARLGFLDNVLSRPFMRGFISSVGFIIIIDQLIEEMGLSEIAAHVGGVSHGTSIDKIVFLFYHFRDSHALTCAIAGSSFLVIMVCRELKRHLQPRYPSVTFFPDRFLVVVLSAVFTWYFRWDRKGLNILGEVKPASNGTIFPFNWPFQFKHMTHIREAMGTSFLIALLGFFESSVAAKALEGRGKGSEGIQAVQLSPNRELVALGIANLLGGCFNSLPAFGGYGRSILNVSTGGKTPVSNILLSIITIFCIVFLLPYFYFLPKAVLSSMITAVAWSLIEEAPHDISFFIRIRGYTELGLMLVILSATVFYSLPLGIAIGVGFSLLSVIKHSTRPRIQILGRIPGTNRFENAEDNPAKLEFIEGCLIVKIPEPLTFANTGDLKNRLRRLELYGTTAAHPALPRVRQPDQDHNVIFDIHGVTSLDGSGAQVLEEIVRNYRKRGVRVFFSRGPSPGTPIWELFRRSGILEESGGESHFVSDVQDALLLAEVEGHHGE